MPYFIWFLSLPQIRDSLPFEERIVSRNSNANLAGCVSYKPRNEKRLMINGAKLRVFKNLGAAQVAVLICQSHPMLTEQRVFALGGELWEVTSLQAMVVVPADLVWALTCCGSLDL